MDLMKYIVRLYEVSKLVGGAVGSKNT